MTVGDPPVWQLREAAIVEVEDLFVNRGFIGLGWPEFGDPLKLPDDKETFRSRFAERYGNEDEQVTALNAFQLWRLVYEMKPGDVVTYTSYRHQQVHLGRIDGPFQYAASISADCPNLRRVKWAGAVPADQFAPRILQQHALLTLCQLDVHAEEFRTAISRMLLRGGLHPTVFQREREGKLAAIGLTQSGSTRRIASQHSLNGAIWAVCDIMRRSNLAGALQYVPEITWLLFLRILDEREAEEGEEAEAVGAEHAPSLLSPYRWQDWAAPKGRKRLELADGGVSGDVFRFVNDALLPHLRGLPKQSGATPRQHVIGEIMSGVERVRIDTERNLLDVLDKLDEIKAGAIDDTHIFTLSQVYEGLLQKMGEKQGDGGQFFTPREVIRAMIRAIDPRPGETVYDPGCGTGGFLAQSYE